jgi:hypothetical protein
LTQLIQPYYGKREPVPASGYVSGQGCYGSIAGAFVGSVMRWFSAYYSNGRGRETALAHAPATGYVATPAIGAEMGAASMAPTIERATAGSASIDGSYGFLTGPTIYKGTDSAASE